MMGRQQNQLATCSHQAASAASCLCFLAQLRRAPLSCTAPIFTQWGASLQRPRHKQQTMQGCGRLRLHARAGRAPRSAGVRAYILGPCQSAESATARQRPRGAMCSLCSGTRSAYGACLVWCRHAYVSSLTLGKCSAKRWFCSAKSAARASWWAPQAGRQAAGAVAGRPWCSRARSCSHSRASTHRCQSAH